MKIINKCGGLPLAIKVMGGLLSTRSQIEREWEAVLNHRAWSISGLPDELDSRIYLSYEDLSPQLKQCFLYLSLFPKGTTIRQTDIVPMWIGEGFIQSCQGGSNTSTDDDRLEEVATEYYEELIMRNLIDPTHSTARYLCTMHDLVRSFAEFMARGESFVVQGNMQVPEGSGNDTKLPVRRMSLGPGDLVPEWAALGKHESLRTLIIIRSKNINFGLEDLLTTFSKLRVLFIWNGGDCGSLKSLDIINAPGIKSVGSEFQQAASSREVAFPNLASLYIEGLCEWEQWDWEDDVTAGAMAMPALEALTIKNCKLGRLPPGLATNNRHALRGLFLYGLTNLACVENFPSVLELDVFDCSELKRISGLPRLHKIGISRCPNVVVLEGVPLLDSLGLDDGTMEALPGYLRDVTPRYLELYCNKKLYESIYSESSCERDKIRHIGKHDINCIE
ncbi:hypothetical protein HU200_013145 [Digitaria exilis]|uniref:Disease resistance protein winged helix domain-containing protein n=1 Tax=Digitaria exilis TaxID=1010633 RepID=A0A835KP41_9POAL|nr:hypothetical protein HU200_013145 [Digitaria exilis]